MNRHLALLSIATFAVSLAVAAAQNPPSQAENAPGEPPVQSVRVGPPPADATAMQLEIQGDKLRAEKSFADAMDYYRAALKKSQTASVWNKIGITELQTGHHKAAIKSFEHAIKLDSKFGEAYNNRGAVYYIEGAQRAAAAVRAGKSVPGGAVKDFHKAVREYQRALAIHEDNASYHSNLGTAYFALKDFPTAMDEYARAMQLDPEVFERRSQSGIAAHMSSPEDRAHYAFVLARMYAKAGNFDRALLYLRKALEDGYKDMAQVYQDQEFATLRKDPRFSELMNSKPTAIPQ